MYLTCVHEKIVVFFSQFTATPHSPTSLRENFKTLNAMRVYSHSYWLVIFCTTNSIAGEGELEAGNFREFLKKHNI